MLILTDFLVTGGGLLKNTHTTGYVTNSDDIQTHSDDQTEFCLRFDTAFARHMGGSSTASPAPAPVGCRSSLSRADTSSGTSHGLGSPSNDLPDSTCAPLPPLHMLANNLSSAPPTLTPPPARAPVTLSAPTLGTVSCAG